MAIIVDSKKKYSHGCFNLNLMLFDLAVGGHHSTYIRHLIEYWRNEKIKNRLFVVVSPEFFEKYSDIVKLAQYPTEFVKISKEESLKLSGAKKNIRRAFLEWKFYCKYAETLKIDHSLLMYVDHFQLPILLGEQSPCRFSGIYFRPSFHYKQFDGHTQTLKDVWRGWRQKILLFLAIRNYKLTALLSLDPYAVPHIKAFSPKNKLIEHLPDPVSAVPVSPQAVSSFKKSLAIDKERRVFLLFGSLSERKGIFQILDAIELLPPDIARRCCLLLVGEVVESIRFSLLKRINDLHQTSLAQIILKSSYQDEDDVPLYFTVSDVVLALYQRHVGMSGIVFLGTAYQKNVISSNYGLMGQFVKDNHLGVTLDSTSIQAIKSAMEAEIFQFKSSHRFSAYSSNLEKHHSPKKFSQVIFRNLVSSKY